MESPIDCDLSSTCFIQQYMDRDPGTGAQDYTCAGLSYDGHKGTDFALPSRAMMAAGVTVRASAAGVVMGVRDGMSDAGFTADNAADIEGRECGNGVRIDHANGWTTQYCHLKQGSLVVRQGQTVAAGDPLGEVGQSGRAAFPHVHLSLRKNGVPTDPFDSDDTLACNTPGDSSLWVDTPVYRPGGLIAVGFSDAVPDYASIKEGTADADGLTTNAPALVIWGYSFGTRADDIMRLSLDGPDGIIIADDVVMTKPQAQAFRAIGKKRRNAPWPAGAYVGTVTLIRAGKTIEQRKTEITLH
ncbi:MAG: M23 family metallopeptidase [Sulfitobacter sp.]